MSIKMNEAKIGSDFYQFIFWVGKGEIAGFFKMIYIFLKPITTQS